ncbi:hypothetical protein [Cupriavidus pauculus]|uniref:Uncharacterized protein n=1 Tax=Cupriavidus pauculus TaxID=82633 RepID=A0A2N5C3X8_9BURK|nr:hypothetical protein [Cupriavidus pauculus]PLP96917.1 hypothetical protein CYJ10_29175 [Cupriavidus pauculus]
MNIPDNLTLYSTVHGHGANGLAFYRYADQDGFGVHLDARRESFGKPFVESYWLDALPDQRFPTLLALQLAAEALTDDQVAAERGKYPQIRNSRPVGERSYQNKCRLCPREDARPGALIVYLARNWNPVTDHRAELCERHKDMADDPAGLDTAIKAEVARRAAKAAPFLESLRSAACPDR